MYFTQFLRLYRPDSVERNFSKENERKLSQKMVFLVGDFGGGFRGGFHGSFQLVGFGYNLKKIL